MNLGFSQKILKKKKKSPRYNISLNSVQWEPNCLMWTDRQIWRNFLDVPKKQEGIRYDQTNDYTDHRVSAKFSLV